MARSASEAPTVSAPGIGPASTAIAPIARLECRSESSASRNPASRAVNCSIPLILRLTGIRTAGPKVPSSGSPTPTLRAGSDQFTLLGDVAAAVHDVGPEQVADRRAEH